MRFYLGCDHEGCKEGFRIEELDVGVDLHREGYVLDVSAFMVLAPDGWELRAGDGGVWLFCENHSAIDGTASEEPGRYPMLHGRCGYCKDTPGVICDFCGNGLGRHADPAARRALTEGRG